MAIFHPQQVFVDQENERQWLILWAEGDNLGLSFRESLFVEGPISLPNYDDDSFAEFSEHTISIKTSTAWFAALLSTEGLIFVTDGKQAELIIGSHFIRWQEKEQAAKAQFEEAQAAKLSTELIWRKTDYPIPDQIMLCCSCDHVWNPCVAEKPHQQGFCPACGSGDIGGAGSGEHMHASRFLEATTQLELESELTWNDEENQYVWARKALVTK